MHITTAGYSQYVPLGHRLVVVSVVVFSKLYFVMEWQLGNSGSSNSSSNSTSSDGESMVQLCDPGLIMGKAKKDRTCLFCGMSP